MRTIQCLVLLLTLSQQAFALEKCGKVIEVNARNENPYVKFNDGAGVSLSYFAFLNERAASSTSAALTLAGIALANNLTFCFDVDSSRDARIYR